MGAKYHFITTIHIDARSETIWEVLKEPVAWGEWWKWLDGVEGYARGDDRGVGAIIQNEVRTPLGYRLEYTATTTKTIEPHLVEFSAEGDLQGRGQFRLQDSGDGTTVVTLNWLVETVQSWMNLAAPLARPLFNWSHQKLMSDFAAGLAQAIGSKLISVQDRAVDRAEPDFYRIP